MQNHKLLYIDPFDFEISKCVPFIYFQYVFTDKRNKMIILNYLNFLQRNNIDDDENAINSYVGGIKHDFGNESGSFGFFQYEFYEYFVSSFLFIE